MSRGTARPDKSLRWSVKYLPNYLIKTLKISAYIFLIFKSALIIIIYFPQIINAKFLRLGYHQVRKKLVSDGQLQKRNKIIETKKT